MQQQRPTLEQYLAQQYARSMQTRESSPRLIAGNAEMFPGLNLTIRRGEDGEQRLPDWQVTETYLANRGIQVKRPVLLAH